MPGRDATRAEMRQVLLALALTSTVRAARLEAPVAEGRPEDRVPNHIEHPAERFVASVTVCWHDNARLSALLEEIRAELDAIKTRQLAEVRVETETELAARVIQVGAGWPARDVAMALRCSERMVRRFRLAAGRDAESGYVVEPVNGEACAFGLQLVSAGFTIRAASMISGIPRSTLHDRMKAAS